MPALIEQWVAMLQDTPLPVLARTLSEIKRLHDDEDRVTTQSIASVVLHDPFMTVKVLRYLQEHRSSRRSTDITTIAHALMMLGLTPFFTHFSVQETLEDKLADNPAAAHGVLTVMSRAWHSALYAHDWARLRHDADPEEVMVAALLHDLAEMLLWYFAPELALEIIERQRNDRALRSETAQLNVIGFRLIDLQLEMVRAWHLPELLHVLMDEDQPHNLRVQNVTYACALARHSAHGWEDLALPDDYQMIGKLLGISAGEAEQCVAYVASHAARDWAWYRVGPAPPTFTDSGPPADK